ncbi:hypothetical protein [Helicobacter pylori]|uniref:hypothetical protein n=1 Tax=Helicobacter pylori TaxID=210 RepID=UPI00035E4D2D|nr:hypothetical protein [Helicobacter pylori]EQL70106.1 hypothetical protein N407_05365 [Helicobacter pylori FD662]
MGFQNENKLELGASVKATINDKVVEAKVISIGFNRVTLRSEKGNEVSYAFNSEKFLKWFNQVELNHAVKSSGEKSTDDLLKGIKVVTSGLTIKQRTTAPKESKESRFKLDFDFPEKIEGGFITMAELYANEKRAKRLGVLFAPMSYNGAGFQASMIIIHALTCAEKLNKHSDAEWLNLIENRNTDECIWETFDQMDREDIRLFCNLILAYADSDMGNLAWEEAFAKTLPKDEAEALFVAQLLCDGGINKYDLSCAGLTANLLKENLGYYGLLVEGEEE